MEIAPTFPLSTTKTITIEITITFREGETHTTRILEEIIRPLPTINFRIGVITVVEIEEGHGEVGMGAGTLIPMETGDRDTEDTPTTIDDSMEFSVW